MGRVLTCLFLFVAPLVAQAQWSNGGAAVAATAPTFEASVGYTYLSMATPGQRIGLGGIDGNALVRFEPRWAVTLDSTYASTGNVLGTGHSGDFLSFLAGPVYYPAILAKAGIFVHVLAGVARVDSAVPVQGTYYLGGWVTRPSYAVGGGVEHSLFGPFAIRAQGDYQRTTFVDSTGATQGQNNLRLTTGIVYRFGRTVE
jgi:hypothetical protein